MWVFATLYAIVIYDLSREGCYVYIHVYHLHDMHVLCIHYVSKFYVVHAIAHVTHVAVLCIHNIAHILCTYYVHIIRMILCSTCYSTWHTCMLY